MSRFLEMIIISGGIFITFVHSLDLRTADSSSFVNVEAVIEQLPAFAGSAFFGKKAFSYWPSLLCFPAFWFTLYWGGVTYVSRVTLPHDAWTFFFYCCLNIGYFASLWWTRIVHLCALPVNETLFQFVSAVIFYNNSIHIDLGTISIPFRIPRRISASEG